MPGDSLCLDGLPSRQLINHTGRCETPHYLHLVLLLLLLLLSLVAALADATDGDAGADGETADVVAAAAEIQPLCLVITLPRPGLTALLQLTSSFLFTHIGNGEIWHARKTIDIG